MVEIVTEEEQMPRKDKKYVVIFDSGVGALPILELIQKNDPQHPIIWLCDNAARPYGDKSDSYIINRATKIFQYLTQKYPVELSIISCNTASTLVLPTLRQTFGPPFVGVVPALKPAASISQSKKLGLLATPATINRSYISDLIATHASHCSVIKLGCTKLVQMAEEKVLGIPPDINAIKEIISPFFADASQAPDTIVLGCTHFPLLIPELKRAAPKTVNWIDSCEAIYSRFQSLVQQITDTVPASNHVIFTDKLTVTPEVKTMFEKYQLTDHEFTYFPT